MPTSDNKIFEEDEDGSENTRPGKYNSIFLFIFLTVVSVILQNAQRKKTLISALASHKWTNKKE